jgi:hypothetical protein
MNEMKSLGSLAQEMRRMMNDNFKRIGSGTLLHLSRSFITRYDWDKNIFLLDFPASVNPAMSPMYIMKIAEKVYPVWMWLIGCLSLSSGAFVLGKMLEEILGVTTAWLVIASVWSIVMIGYFSSWRRSYNELRPFERPFRAWLQILNLLTWGPDGPQEVQSSMAALENAKRLLISDAREVLWALRMAKGDEHVAAVQLARTKLKRDFDLLKLVELADASYETYYAEAEKELTALQHA